MAARLPPEYAQRHRAAGQALGESILRRGAAGTLSHSEIRPTVLEVPSVPEEG